MANRVGAPGGSKSCADEVLQREHKTVAARVEPRTSGPVSFSNDASPYLRNTCDTEARQKVTGPGWPDGPLLPCTEAGWLSSRSCRVCAQRNPFFHALLAAEIFYPALTPRQCVESRASSSWECRPRPTRPKKLT